MPTDVVIQPHNNKVDYRMVPPGHMLPVEVYSEQLDADMVVTALCDTEDLTTAVFMFEHPEGVDDISQLSADELVRRCLDGVELAKLDHDMTSTITARDRDREPLEIYIGHTVALFPDLSPLGIMAQE
jgi:hypothetical protein